MSMNKELNEKFSDLLEEYEFSVARYNILAHTDVTGIINLSETEEYCELSKARFELESFVMSLIVKTAE